MIYRTRFMIAVIRCLMHLILRDPPRAIGVDDLMDECNSLIVDLQKHIGK